MAVYVSMIRPRVPMLDASALDERTRPALDQRGSLASRRRPRADWAQSLETGVKTSIVSAMASQRSAGASGATHRSE